MKWKSFLSAAGSPETGLHRGPIWSATRWLSLRVSFVLFHLRISGNQVSLLGWALAILWLASVLFHTTLPGWAKIVCLASCYGSVFMDFCDGSVARVRRESGPVGAILDGISNGFLRSGNLIVLGITASSGIFMLIGLVSSYLIIMVRYQFVRDGVYVENYQSWLGFALVRAFSVPVMTGILGTLIVLADCAGQLLAFSCTVVVLYFVLAITWFYVACSGGKKQVVQSQEEVQTVETYKS